MNKFEKNTEYTLKQIKICVLDILLNLYEITSLNRDYFRFTYGHYLFHGSCTVCFDLMTLKQKNLDVSSPFWHSPPALWNFKRKYP
jgi:hypothetical protein